MQQFEYEGRSNPTLAKIEEALEERGRQRIAQPLLVSSRPLILVPGALVTAQTGKWMGYMSDAPSLHCLQMAGGSPIGLPPLPLIQQGEPLDVIDHDAAFQAAFDLIWSYVLHLPVRGLCLTGGGDLYSPLYGQRLHPQTEEPDLWRDIWERYLLLIGWVLHWPLLGICRGMQQANVVLGGGLFQDIRSQWPRQEDVPSPVRHRAGGRVAADNWAAHTVAIHAPSRLWQWVSGRGPARSHIEVLSMHHQMVGVLSRQGQVIGFPAPGLVPTATAFDGVIEALESADPRRVSVLVQFHPEWAVNPFGMQDWAENLFAGFMGACEDYTPLDPQLLGELRPKVCALVRALDQQWLGWSAVAGPHDVCSARLNATRQQGVIEEWMTSS